MPCGSVLTKIKVKIIIFFFKTKLIHSCKKCIIIIFSLTAADYLAYPRYETIHCGNCLAVFVELHIKGLDLLRIIRYKHRPLEFFFRKESLMFRLKITSPAYLILEFIIMLFKYLHGICVCHPAEIR